jgi:hypothetical protein
MAKNPNLDGPKSPTPPVVYEPRIWRARIWKTGAGRGGAGVVFKAPYGVYMNAVQVLARAAARGQISRIQYGPVPAAELKHWTKEDRAALERYEDVFAKLGAAHQIDWDA